jgi:hypothetical protein
MKQNPPNPKGSRGWLVIVIMFAAAVLILIGASSE